MGIYPKEQVFFWLMMLIIFIVAVCVVLEGQA